MAIEINCPECQALLRLDDETAGRQARCPSCSAVFSVVAPTPDTETSAGGVSPATPTPRSAVDYVAGNQTGADAPNPYAPTITEPAVKIPSEFWPRQITPEEVFPRAWAIFKDQWVMACVAVLIVGAINFGMNMVSSGVNQVVVANNNDPIVFFAVQFLMGFGTFIIQIWLQIGQIMVMLDIARGREVVISKLFGGGSLLLHSLLAMIMFWLAIAGIVIALVGLPAAAVGLATQDGQAASIAGFVGGLIAIVPLIVVSLMFSQFQLLIIDRGVSSIESLRLSSQITSGNKLSLFLIFILLMVMGFAAMIVGLLALCVGVFPAMIGFGAYSALVLVVTYLSMTGQYIADPRPSVGHGQPTNPTNGFGG